MQVIERNDFGSLLGSSLGSGIGQLAQQKIHQMQTRKGLEGLLGPDMARQISQLPPEIAKQVINQKLKAAQQQETYNRFQQQYGGQQQGAKPGLETILAGSQQQQQQGQPESGDFLSQLLPQTQTGENILNSFTQQGQEQPVGLEQSSGYVPGKQASLALSLGVDPGKAVEIEEKAKEAAIKFERENRKESFERKKFMTEQESKMWDKSDPYINDIIEKSKSSKIQNMDLDRLEEIGDKLTGPAWDSFLKGSGFDLDALRSPESAEFASIKMGFMKDMKKYFGGNVTTREMEGFLKTLPSLSQTPEGRKRIIANMKRINNIGIEYEKAMKKVIKRNKNVPPRGLTIKVEEVMDKRVKKVASQFRRDLARYAPEFTPVQKVGTAIAHGAGSVIGAVPKFIGGITKLLGGLGG